MKVLIRKSIKVKIIEEEDGSMIMNELSQSLNQIKKKQIKKNKMESSLGLISHHHSLAMGAVILECSWWNSVTNRERRFLIDCSQTVQIVPEVKFRE